jgi:hypothetical protein
MLGQVMFKGQQDHGFLLADQVTYLASARDNMYITSCSSTYSIIKFLILELHAYLTLNKLIIENLS